MRNWESYDIKEDVNVKHTDPNLRYHVFISKDSTKQLAEYILPEPWGQENNLLYKYLDYTWRCVLFDNQVYKFQDSDRARLVFNTGLQRRSDASDVYLVLIPNDAQDKDQRWRVASSPPHYSFMVPSSLRKFTPSNNLDELPKRVQFFKNPMELVFNPAFEIVIDWDERLHTCKERIYGILNEACPQMQLDERILAENELRRLFEDEFRRSELIARANPRYAIPQGFVDSKKNKSFYRLELLLPLPICYHDRIFWFALALQPSDNLYTAMSILTSDMAYANARLVGRIESSWLSKLVPVELDSMRYENALDLDRMSRSGLSKRLGPPPGLAMPYTGQRLVSVPRIHSEPAPRISSSRFAFVQEEQPDRHRELYVKNVPKNWKEKTLQNLFSKYGTVKRIKILIRDDNPESELNRALLEMAAAHEAVHAMRELNGHENLEIEFKKVKKSNVSRQLPMQSNLPRPRSNFETSIRSRTVYVQGLSSDSHAGALRQLFDMGPSDDLESIHVFHPDKVAYARFRDFIQAQKAVIHFKDHNRLQVTLDRFNRKLPGEKSVYWEVQRGVCWEKYLDSTSQTIESLPPTGGQTMIELKLRKYTLVRFDKNQGKQINKETGNERMIRRVEVEVWINDKPSYQLFSARFHRSQSEGMTVPNPNGILNGRQRHHFMSPEMPRGPALPPPIVPLTSNIPPIRPIRSMGSMSASMGVSMSTSMSGSIRPLRPAALSAGPPPLISLPEKVSKSPLDVLDQISRGSVEWIQVENTFHKSIDSNSSGVEILHIKKWKTSEDEEKLTDLTGMRREELWFGASPQQLNFLCQVENFIAPLMDTYEHNRKGYMFHLSPLTATQTLLRGSEEAVNALLCNVNLTEDEGKNLYGDRQVLVSRLESISPQYLVVFTRRIVGISKE